MPVYKIPKHPTSCNYFLVDSNFLANKFLKPDSFHNAGEKDRIQKCQEWWTEIDRQMKRNKGKVYVTELCIAETFKVLAKKNFEAGIFKYPSSYRQARERLSKFLHMSPKQLRSHKRHVRCHDIDTNRDIVISVDRCFEKLFKMKKKKQVRSDPGIVDLMLLATEKYLLDFYGLTKRNLFIISADGSLCKLAKSFPDLPRTVNPLHSKVTKVFDG
ncbi:MAG TPA: hypothetical protein VJO34_07580 [Methylomirabilota bacterium]|nr:hypothetical protein [Methylomirabilota bacterium]